MKCYGFTGTSRGMTPVQRDGVARRLLAGGGLLRHGDCVGADAQTHEIARNLGMRVHGHPPLDPKGRAWCECDELEPEREYLERNRDIVDACDELVAAPGEMRMRTRSGTWSTVRYARKVGRRVTIVFPDGSTVTE